MADSRPHLTKNARTLLEQRYLRRDDGRNIIETPHGMYDRIASAIADAELSYGGKKARDEWYWKFLDALLNLEIVPSSPYMFNCGTKGGGLFACFVLPMEDSISGIYKCISEAAMVYKASGGVGVSLSKLRENGALVRTTKGASTGPMSFLAVMDSSAKAVQHGGFRRAASLACLDIDHPDIEEFIEAKSRNLHEINRLRHIILCSRDKALVNFAKSELDKLQEYTAFNLSVKITDKFMEAVKNNEEWDLVSRLDGSIVRTLPARKLFRKIVHYAWKSAEPGVLFYDNMNRDNALKHVGNILATNPCLSGEMRLFTNKGYASLSELAKYGEVEIINSNGDVVKSKVWKSGKKKTIEVCLYDGTTIVCTPDHRFMLENGAECEAQYLLGKTVMRSSMSDSGKVQSITDGAVVDVYDFSEPETNWGIVEGCVLHNCGEQPLLDFEACNLATINLNKVLKDNRINWEHLRYLSSLATRFCDDAIDVSGYPIPEIEETVKKSRKIGVCIMGLADILIKLRIPYDSEEARSLALKIMNEVGKSCIETSKQLAKEKGTFPLYEGSTWQQKGVKVRNSAMTSIAPNGSTSIVAGASASAEPLFNVYYVRRTADGKQFIEVHEQFRKDIEEAGLNIEDIVKKLEKIGTIQKINEVPQWIKDVYKCANDIRPEDHVLMQSSIQKTIIGGATSKTVNCPSDATEKDIYNLYMLAWETGCKGITVYREGCRNAVLSTKSASVEDHERQFVQFLEQKYVDEEYSVQEISDMLGVSTTTVFTKLKKYGIKRRSIEDIKKAKQKKLSNTLLSVIYGNLLGTSKIITTNKQGSFRLITRHFEYARYARSLFVDQGIDTTKVLQIYTDVPYYYFDSQFLEELYDIGELFFTNGRRVVPDIELTAEILRHYYLSEGTRMEKGGIKLFNCPKKLRRLIEKAADIEITDRGDDAYIPKAHTDNLLAYIEHKEDIAEIKTEERCSECGGELIRQEKCVQCSECGWSKCSL